LGHDFASARGHFIKITDGIVRLTSGLAKTLLGETALPEQDIVQATDPGMILGTRILLSDQLIGIRDCKNEI